MAAARKPKHRFLDHDALEDLLSEPVPLDGVFQLLPPTFEPLDGEPDLDDGTPPTSTGKALMEFWGACHERDPQECPNGLVRAIEAVSATPRNADAIRQALRGSGSSGARWERNHAGLFATATLEVLVPMVGQATVQPRGNATYGRTLRNAHGQPLIHEIGDGLLIEGQSAEHFDNIRTAQHGVIAPGDYSGDRRNFVDSLALEGIKEPLRGFAFHLSTQRDGSGYCVETNDGYTRVAVAQHTMGRLLGGLPTDLSRMHWGNGDGTETVRDWNANAIARAFEELRFEAAPFEVWPTTATTAGIRNWVANASLEAQAVMRLMTAKMSVGIAVQPYKKYSTHNVVYADMSRFHVKGHQPEPWARTDDEAFKARSIVSDLVAHGYVDADERDVFLGHIESAWKDDASRGSYRNRLVATLDPMVKIVVEDPAIEGRYPTVRSSLKGMRVANSPTQAAATAASLSVIVAGLEGASEMGAFAAMLKRSFASRQLRRLADHPGDWTLRFTEDLDAIVEGARSELDGVLGTAKHAEYLGPNMRALAVLGMVAHGMNPQLIDHKRPDGVGEDGEAKMVRWPSSMTFTGRGGRAGAGAAEAHVITFHMAQSPKGIDQLEAIVRAVTDQEAPLLPLDPQDREPLLEDDLRVLWNKAPTIDGEPRPADGPGPEPSGDDAAQGAHGPEGRDDLPDRSTLSEEGEWERQASIFRDELRGLAAKARVMRDTPAGHELLDLDPEEWDPDDDTLEKMLAVVGIDQDTVEGYDDDLEVIRKFFFEGLVTRLRAKAGS